MRTRKAAAHNRSALRTSVVLWALSMLVLAAAPASAKAGARQLWVARYDDRHHSTDYANTLAVSPDGSTVFVTGTDYLKWITVAYDAIRGTRRWTAKYHPLGSGYNEPDRVAVSPDGSTVFVTGGTRSRATGWDAATVAYDASTGAQVWAARYTGGPGKAYASGSDIAVSSDGSTVFVAPGPIVAYEATTGAQLWVSRTPGGHLAVSPDGSRVFATRSRQRGRGIDYFTSAVDAGTGDRVWSRWYGSPDSASDDLSSAIGVSADGSEVFVTGTGLGDYLTIAYDASGGATRWIRRYDGPAHGGDNARGLTVSPDGSSVYVTGDSHGPGTGDDYATVAYDAGSGAQEWVRRYSGVDDGNEEGEAITTSPQGSAVYVTGISNGDYLTLSYDASTGSRIWRQRYNGPGDDFDVAVWIAASPDASRVFVTGSSVGDGTASDYATIAYRA